MELVGVCGVNVVLVVVMGGSNFFMLKYSGEVGMSYLAYFV